MLTKKTSVQVHSYTFSTLPSTPRFHTLSPSQEHPCFPHLSLWLLISILKPLPSTLISLSLPLSLPFPALKPLPLTLSHTFLLKKMSYNIFWCCFFLPGPPYPLPIELFVLFLFNKQTNKITKRNTQKIKKINQQKATQKSKEVHPDLFTFQTIVCVDFIPPPTLVSLTGLDSVLSPRQIMMILPSKVSMTSYFFYMDFTKKYQVMFLQNMTFFTQLTST